MDTVKIDAEVPAPSFLKRIPVKKVAIVTAVVAGAVLAGKYLKDNSDVNVDVVPETNA